MNFKSFITNVASAGKKIWMCELCEFKSQLRQEKNKKKMTPLTWEFLKHIKNFHRKILASKCPLIVSCKAQVSFKWMNDSFRMRHGQLPIQMMLVIRSIHWILAKVGGLHQAWSVITSNVCGKMPSIPSTRCKERSIKRLQYRNEMKRRIITPIHRSNTTSQWKKKKIYI